MGLLKQSRKVAGTFKAYNNAILFYNLLFCYYILCIIFILIFLKVFDHCLFLFYLKYKKREEGRRKSRRREVRGREGKGERDRDRGTETSSVCWFTAHDNCDLFARERDRDRKR